MCVRCMCVVRQASESIDFSIIAIVFIHTHIHTHIYIFIYIYIYVCVYILLLLLLLSHVNNGREPGFASFSLYIIYNKHTYTHRRRLAAGPLALPIIYYMLQLAFTHNNIISYIYIYIYITLHSPLSPIRLYSIFTISIFHLHLLLLLLLEPPISIIS